MATISAPAFELDPLFLKALQLLHSKSKDSADQLKQLLDEVLQKPGSTSTHTETKPFLHTIKQEIETTTSSKHSTMSTSSRASPRTVGDSNHPVSSGPSRASPRHMLEPSHQTKKVVVKEERREPEKRSFDKIKSSSDAVQEVPAKKAHLETPHSSASSSPSISSSPITVKDEPADLNVSISESEDDDLNKDADVFAREMGLACVVCRLFDMKSGNTLVECQECHSLYHKECHKPPITDQDVNDPRLVWYCARCTKTMKRMTSKPQKTSKPTATIQTVKEPPAKSSKAEPPPLTPQLFKRAEIKSTSQSSIPANSGNNGSRPTGLAGLAAILNTKSAPPSKPFTAQGNNKPVAPTSKPAAVSGNNNNNKTSLAAIKPAPIPAANNNKPASLFKPSPPALQKTTSGQSSSTTRSSPFANLATGNKPSGSGGNGSSSVKPNTSQGLAATSTIKSASVAAAVAKLSSAASSAASSSASSASSSSGASSAASSGKSAGSSSLMSADKRLQIMKKKAAAKMQEKRRLSSK